MAKTYLRRLAGGRLTPRGRAHALACMLAAGTTFAAASGCSPTGALIGAGATAGLVVAEERSVADAVADTGIDLAINKALFDTDLDGLFRAVNVDVVEGRVLLTGRVADDGLIDQATEIAWGVSGVRQVINELRIGADNALDDARDRLITGELRARILRDAEVFDINYTITTVAGVIYLIGIAQDRAERDRVVAHARDIEYVRKVVNHVRLKGTRGDG